jgi:hypothetical protein
MLLLYRLVILCVCLRIHVLHTCTAPLGYRKADELVQSFWRHLKDADCSENALSLKEGTFFLGSPMLGSQLLLRPVYAQLEQRMQQLMADNEHCYFPIVGTPGK